MGKFFVIEGYGYWDINYAQITGKPENQVKRGFVL